jgi:hypothetical protein
MKEYIPSTGMPSLCHVITASGLLELESHVSVASIPVFSSSGVTDILAVSGATVNENKIKI